MKRIYVLFVILLVVFVCQAQENEEKTPQISNSDQIVGADQVISTPFFAGALGWTFPFGEMGNRYESFFNVDANLGWKTKSNWLYILDFCFQFGNNNVKNLNNILSNLMTDDTKPFIVGNEGTDAGVVAYSRNLSLSFGIGKIFPLWFSNPNSGLTLTFNLGYLQHQIVYQSTLGRVPQLEGDYAYGYDRQMRGYMLSLFFGYTHMSKKNYANWYAGVQGYMARTKMSRKYQFDLMSGDNNTYTDYMLTLKLGWMFPFFGRKADKIYFF